MRLKRDVRDILILAGDRDDQVNESDGRMRTEKFDGGCYVVVLCIYGETCMYTVLDRDNFENYQAKFVECLSNGKMFAKPQFVKPSSLPDVKT